MAQELDEILLGFVEELEGYIPFIREGVAELRANPDNKPMLDETRRLMHIVRGAAAMLGMDALSRLGKSVEQALDHVRDGEMRLGDELLGCVQRAAELFEEYSRLFRKGGAPDEPELATAVQEVCAVADSLPLDGTGKQEASAAPTSVAAAVGVTLPAGIELDEELMASFTEEVNGHFEDISNALQALESRVTDAVVPVQGEVSGLLRDIRRSVHTVKGASAVLGLQHIADVGHRIEDVLDWFYESAGRIDHDQVTVLSQLLDQLDNLVRNAGNYDANMVEECLQFLQNQMKDSQNTPGAQAQAGADADALLGDEAGLFADEEIGSAGEDTGLFDKAAVGSMTPAGIELDEELMASFTEEVNGHFEDISNALQALESRVTDAAVPVQGEVSGLLRDIRRSVHTVKGASAVLGLQHIADVGHRIEDVLDWFYESAGRIDHDQVTVLSQLLDQLDNLVRNAGNYDANMVEECLQFLQNQMATVPGSSAGQAKADTDADALLGDEAGFVADGDEGLFPDVPALPGDTTSNATMTPTGIELDEELLAAFNEEVAEHFEDLDSSMRHLETLVESSVPVNGDVSEFLRGICRSVHTVKGASAVLGMQHIADMGHRIEDVLDWFCEQGCEIDHDEVATLALILDQFENLVRSPDSYEAGVVDDGLARLQQRMGDAHAPRSQHSAEIAASATARIESATSACTSMFSTEEQKMLRAGFMEEAEEHLQKLSLSLQKLEGCVSQSVPMNADLREEVRTIRRAVHTIKGASAVIGITDIADYAHKVEDYLDWLFEKANEINPETVSLLVESVDILGDIVANSTSVDEMRRQNMYSRLAGAIGATLPEVPSATVAEDTAEKDKQLAVQKLKPVDPPLQHQYADQEDATSKPAPAVSGEAAKTIRIHQSQLDKFINLANELLVGVSGFDRNMERFSAALEELDLTVQRLKDIAQELETKFEVKALDQMAFHSDRIEQTSQEIKADIGQEEFDGMELDHYTQLNLIIRALNESAIDVASLHTNLESVRNGLGVDISRQHRVVRELQVQMMRTRLSPMSILTPRLSRTVREVAARLRKRVRLVMEGDSVELDRVIWEKLADPFMHLVRNSIDHGIEDAAEREASGKPAIATIRIAGTREGHHVVVRYSDDGKGINIASIRNKARQTMGSAVDSMDEQKLIALIFSPGFSTQETITQISGRGVGMDVVKQNIHDLQGTITVDTRQGKGTQFTIRVPLTLGVVRALLVEVEGVTYGIALNEIVDIHRVDQADIAGDGKSFRREKKKTPLYDLPTLLGRPVSADESKGGNPLVFTVHSEGGLAGVRTMHIIGQKEVVIKGLGNHLRSVIGIAGAAVMGDGAVIPLLNMSELLAAHKHQAEPEAGQKKAIQPKTLTIMIVDDSISIRRVMSRLVTNQGWIPVEAKDGQDAFEKLDAVRPDCILLDVEMPRMNGFEFLALKANLTEHRHIPVIMLTSRTSDKHRNKALELGASIYLNKPTKEEDFVEAVLQLTGHNRDVASQRQTEVTL